MSSEQHSTSNAKAVEDAEEEIDLLSLFIPLLKAKRRILLWTGAALAFGLLIAFSIKPVFTAEAVILPPQQQSSASSLLLGQLGALGSLGGGSALGLKNPADMFIGILQSRSIADQLIDDFHLQDVYRDRFRIETRKELARNTNVESSKDGLIHITVKDHDPKRAAALTNAYVDQLHTLNARLAIGEAAQRRLFFDQQISKESLSLAQSEEAFKAMQVKTGVIQLSGQAQMTLSMIAGVQAQIASREVQLGVVRTFATDENPDVTRLQQEISSLKSHLATLESGQQGSGPGDVQVSSGRVPEASLEYLRKARDVRYHEALFELLAKQREAASLDEAKSAPLIQVVDSAVVPERKSGPPRVLIVLGSGFLGFLIAIFTVFVRSVFATMRLNSEQSTRIQQFKDALG